MTTAIAQMVGRQPPRDRENPGFETSPRIKARQVLVHSEEGFLEQVLRVRSIADSALQEPDQRH